MKIYSRDTFNIAIHAVNMKIKAKNNAESAFWPPFLNVLFSSQTAVEQGGASFSINAPAPCALLHVAMRKACAVNLVSANHNYLINT